MDSRILFNRKSVIFKVAAAFLLLVITPFSIGLVYLNIAYEEQIRTRWLEESESRLINLQNEITNMHLDLNSMLVQIRQDDAFSPHRIRRNSYQLMLARNQLQRYQATNSVIHVLAYVEMPDGILLTNISSDDHANFASRFFHVDDYTRDLFWYEVGASDNNAFAEPLMVIPSATSRGNLLAYVVNLRETRIFDTPVLLVLLDAIAIEAQLSVSLPRESAGVIITNRYNQILLSAGNLPVDTATLILAERESYYQDYLLTHSVAANGWHYFMFLPEADLLQEVRGATRLYILFGLAFAGASILFFVLIYTVYRALLQKTDTIQRQLDDSYPIRRSSLLHQLISGGISEKEGLKQSSALSLNLDEKRYFTVALLFAADGESFLDLDIQAFLSEYLINNQLGYLIVNVLDDALTILLNPSFPEHEAHKLEVVRLQANITDMYNIHTMACIGGNYSRLGDIRLSFQEAVRTSRYRNITNRNNCITFSETGEDSAFSRSYPTKIIQSFYYALSNEKPEAIIERLREIARLMEGFTITLSRCIYCDLAFGIFHHFQGKSPVPPLCAELLDDITLALESQEMRELQRLMSNLEISFLDVKVEEENINLADKVRQYVDMHFHESSLSILEIAESLGVSTGHLSRSYKKETGETLLNYINAKRIEKAKNLLQNTDMPLHEIVNEIGYLDVSSFHRKFKATEGMTTGVFRDRNR